MKLFQTVLSASSFLVSALFCAAGQADTIKFSGYEWETRTADKQGPGPNDWNAKNAFVDAQGRLHLKISKVGEKWSCAEITSKKLLSFGNYQRT